MKILMPTLLILILSGCVPFFPDMTLAPRDAQREFTYDFVVAGKSKSEIWKSARDFFAETYGDSRAVFRVMDEQDGTIIGRGASGWSLFEASSSTCVTDYHVRFAAKDNKARLQFEIIEGVPPHSPCTGWPWPTQKGYDAITQSFAGTASSLNVVLLGQSPGGKLKDF